MKFPKLPKRISIHISPNYTDKSFSRTFSRGAVLAIVSGAGAFLAGVVLMLVYALNIYGKVLNVDAIARRKNELEQELRDIPKLQRRIEEIEQQRKQVRFMLGAQKSADTVDFTNLVFHYRPVPPPGSDTTDTMPLDSTMLIEDEGGFFLVPPVVGWTRISQVFTASHPGIDFATSEGKQVLAACDGSVSDVGYDEIYGNYILLRHSSNFETFYGHLQSANVRKGQNVAMNQVIGFVGSTGRSTAPHLHFEARHDGTPINPSGLLVLGREYKGGAYDSR